jgi:hypothetical protein
MTTTTSNTTGPSAETLKKKLRRARKRIDLNSGVRAAEKLAELNRRETDERAARVLPVVSPAAPSHPAASPEREAWFQQTFNHERLAKMGRGVATLAMSQNGQAQR